MVNTCHNCKKECEASSNEFYKEEIGNIYNKITHINEIKNKILDYLYHINGHIIWYKIKYRGEIFQYTFTVCTKCFQCGIYSSLEHQERLPFLRKDIHYFIRDYTNIDITQLKKIYNNYIFPSTYVCDYYRKPHPELIGNFFVIKSFNN